MDNAVGHPGDALDAALAVALQVASAAADLSTIAALVAELRARREAAAGGHVVHLDAARRGGR